MSTLPGALSASSQPDDEQVWLRFLSWLPTAEPSDHPGTLLQEYRTHLIASGTLPSDTGGHLATITRLMRVREDGWQQIFNQIYRSSRIGFHAGPNALLMSAVESRTPGRALDAGMGQGRNAVFLAIKGWNVTGFDVSEEGLEIARRNATYAGVQVNAMQMSNRSFDYGTELWDLIVITYEPFPVCDPAYTQRLRAALAPGGLLVVESFASDSTSSNRRPVDIDPAELADAVSSFSVLHFEDTEAVADWTLQKTRIVRLIAQKE